MPNASQFMSVSDVNSLVSLVIKNEPLLDSILVAGEIVNMTRHSSGHIYFTLKDDQSRIRAVMFKFQAYSLRFKPSDGMKVVVRGSVQVYQRGGEYQLYVEAMEPIGVGELYAAFESLKKKLDAEGLFAPEHKRPIPEFCKKIVVVTSPTGAAIRDILNIGKRRFPGLKVVLSPALVQGIDAPKSIVKAMNLAKDLQDVDCLIVGRGGGAMEELWAFNDEEVARTIRQMPFPVVSAVGHEIDFTISDFAADLRAPTPSAAAELVVPDVKSVIADLDRMAEDCRMAVDDLFTYCQERLETLCEARWITHPFDSVRERRQEVDEVTDDIYGGLRHMFDRAHAEHQRLSGLMAAFDPMAVLRRGYAVCRNEDGVLIRSSSQLDAAQKVEIKFSSGSARCRVEEIENELDMM